MARGLQTSNIVPAGGVATFHADLDIDDIDIANEEAGSNRKVKACAFYHCIRRPHDFVKRALMSVALAMVLFMGYVYGLVYSLAASDGDFPECDDAYTTMRVFSGVAAVFLIVLGVRAIAEV
jgi:hypothetical protein